MSIKIVTDSSCDLPQGVADALGIVIVPLSIRFGDDEYIDRTTITTDRFWQLCSSSKELPQTAAPSPGQFLKAFRDLSNQGATGIVVISLSSSLSFTMQSAVNAAKEMEGQIPVRVIDSRNASLGVGLIAVECAERARAGDSLEAIAELADSLVPRTHVFGALDTLENLRKGGRIGGAKAMLGTALSVKPLIEVRNGEVEEAGKQRTRGKALAALIETLRNAGKVERLGVLHAQCPDIDDFVAKVREIYPGDIMIGDIGAVIGTHAGQGTIGIAFRTAQ
jgi:DegV family protein with EDD domain